MSINSRCFWTYCYHRHPGGGGGGGVDDSNGGHTLYDDFSGSYIDSSKWHHNEFVRKVDPVQEKLVSKVASDSENVFNSTFFQNPLTINAIKAGITVVETSVDTGTNVMARIGGMFYNTQAAGGFTGEVLAAVGIFEEGSGLGASWFILEFLDDNGDTWNLIDSGTLISAGTLSYSTEYEAEIVWTAGTNQFSFTLNSQSATATGPGYARQAVDGSKRLTTRTYFTTGTTGYISALFDNVFINGSGTAYDTFDTAPINRTNWSSDEVVREISNGALQLDRQGFDDRSTMGISLVDNNTDYLGAEVTVEIGSSVSAGATGIARLNGYYYNDTFGPGSHNGYEGNVFVQIRIRLDESDNLITQAFVDRSDNADETLWTPLYSHDFTTKINFDEDYSLSIEFTGSELIFTCDGEQDSYNITTATHEPYNEFRGLRSRVYLDSGESGYIKVKFDNVYVD
ncbi:MAG: hypothetical protein JRD05_01340 [Deltaproteobacteria bacterium]|nr:hypothetical protein [Deltaproteobacteria bacterium]